MAVDAEGSKYDFFGLKQPFHCAGERLAGEAGIVIEGREDGGRIIPAALIADLTALGVAFIDQPQESFIAFRVLGEPVERRWGMFEDQSAIIPA